MGWRRVFAVFAACILQPACAGAADSLTVTINTTVLPVCRFSASGPANFDTNAGGAVDAGQAAPLSATGAITYRCTNGVAPAFAITAAAGCGGCPDARGIGPVILSDNGGVGRGMGSGRDLTLIVAGPVGPAPVQTASVGVALADVSITVSP